MRISGGCHCGAIAYEADVEPGALSVCHCTDCQKLSGSAFRTSIPNLPGTFRIVRGTPKIYVKRTADSGAPRAQGFCGECGSPIYSAPLDSTNVVMIRTGTVEQRAHLRPRNQIWHRSAQPWIDALGDVPKIERQS
jgi:hypothetical protein